MVDARRNRSTLKHHHIRLIAKQRPFDEEQWKRLLIAFAYVLHERRTTQTHAEAQPTTSSDDTATDDAPTSGDIPWTP